MFSQMSEREICRNQSPCRTRQSSRERYPFWSWLWRVQRRSLCRYNLTAAGAQWPCGKSAISALEALALGKAVKCDSRGQDDHGLTIGVCTVNNVDLNAAMVSKGYAWAFRKYSTDYSKAEDDARVRKVGVWQAQTQTPWEYRAAKWEVAKQDARRDVQLRVTFRRTGISITLRGRLGIRRQK